MTSTYTVDASVFVNGFNPYEAGHEESRRLLALLQEQAAPIVVPTLLLPEVAAAISRGRQDADLAREFAAALSRLPHLVLIPLPPPGPAGRRCGGTIPAAGQRRRLRCRRLALWQHPDHPGPGTAGAGDQRDPYPLPRRGTDRVGVVRPLEWI